MAVDHNAPRYILETGINGAKNLDLQDSIFKKESYDQLKEARLAEGMVVWDIGCGSGAMTEYLAQVVGPQGVVYAIDQSAESIEITKQKIKSAGYSNVVFIVGCIEDIEPLKHRQADIVFSRFLLMHVKNPKLVVRIMSSLLKSGGILSLQESSLSSVAINNPNAAIRRYYELIIKYGHNNGFDYDIGRKLPKICYDLGIFTSVKYYTKHHNTTNKIKNLLSLRLDEMQYKLQDSDLIGKKDYLELKFRIKVILNDKKIEKGDLMSEQTHVLAYKS